MPGGNSLFWWANSPCNIVIVASNLVLLNENLMLYCSTSNGKIESKIQRSQHVLHQICALNSLSSLKQVPIWWKTDFFRGSFAPSVLLSQLLPQASLLWEITLLHKQLYAKVSLTSCYDNFVQIALCHRDFQYPSPHKFVSSWRLYLDLKLCYALALWLRETLKSK